MNRARTGEEDGDLEVALGGGEGEEVGLAAVEGLHELRHDPLHLRLRLRIALLEGQSTLPSAF